jgi:hypothetical protein
VQYDQYIAHRLMEILKLRKKGFDVEEMYRTLTMSARPLDYNGLTEDATFWERIIAGLRYEIRFSEVDQWDNFHRPLRFR